MKELIPLEFKNQRIMTTKVLSEQFGTEDKIIHQNFKRNEDRFIEGKHYYKLEGEELKEFKANLHLEGNLKFIPVLYLWTERGAARHAKILDTDEAWEVYEKLEETYFRVQKEITKLSKELQAIFMLDEKTQELGDRIGKLENNMTIDYAQQEELNTLAKKVVVKTLGGVDAPAYKELNKKAFSQFWKDYKTILQVNSYKNTAVKDFVFARKVMVDWKPSRELELMIKGANSQIRM